MCDRENQRADNQIIKYCNKAEDTFIETSIKSENKDIQLHTNMSVHMCDINLPEEFKLFIGKKLLSISEEINSVHDHLSKLLAKTQHFLIIVSNSCTQYVKIKNIFIA